MQQETNKKTARAVLVIGIVALAAFVVAAPSAEAGEVGAGVYCKETDEEGQLFGYYCGVPYDIRLQDDDEDP